MNEQEIQANHIKLQLSYSDYSEKMGRSLTNTSLDKYYITYEIDGGAFGTIYKGINKSTNTQVAIKLLNLRKLIQLQKNPKVKQIKKRLADSESRIMMAFNSPYIMKCYECFENLDLKIMVIEYCNGGSLQQKIDKMKKIPVQEAIAILKQIINGIAVCHKKKVIHRDLKPANILIHNGQYKIADFGFSKQLDITYDNEIGQHTHLGTMTTMAPQVMNKQDYGLKADIWSIGVIFFIMIFGKCPFKSDSTKEILLEMKEQFLAQQNYNGVVPSPKVKKFLKQVLQVNPLQRLGWKQLVNHELFENQGQSLPDDFYLQVSIKNINKEFQEAQLVRVNIDYAYPSNLLEQIQQKGKSQEEKSQQIKLQEEQEVEDENLLDGYLQKENIQEENPQKDFLYIKNSQIKQTNTNQKALKSYKDSKLDQSKVVLQQNFDRRSHIFVEGIKLLDKQDILKIQINRQEQDLFKWSQQTYIECLKTQIILQKIIEPIEAHKNVNLNDRQVIQMIYLICTRCNNNILPIFYEYEKRKHNSRVLKDLHAIIDKLHKKVLRKHQKYSEKLTNKENSKSQIFLDVFRKIAKKQQMKNKDKFLGGVQNMAQFRNRPLIQQDLQQERLQDYQKIEQIQFTVKYIDNFLKSMNKDKYFIEIQKYLKHYFDICKIKKQDLTDKNFQDHVKLLIMENKLI